MSFISVFDVLGPNMIGPSSSHTAGAAAIALLAGKMPNAAIKKAHRSRRIGRRRKNPNRKNQRSGS